MENVKNYSVYIIGLVLLIFAGTKEYLTSPIKIRDRPNTKKSVWFPLYNFCCDKNRKMSFWYIINR